MSDLSVRRRMGLLCLKDAIEQFPNLPLKILIFLLLSENI